jgi:hypothetical protein
MEKDDYDAVDQWTLTAEDHTLVRRFCPTHRTGHLARTVPRKDGRDSYFFTYDTPMPARTSAWMP